MMHVFSEENAYKWKVFEEKHGWRPTACLMTPANFDTSKFEGMIGGRWHSDQAKKHFLFEREEDAFAAKMTV